MKASTAAPAAAFQTRRRSRRAHRRCLGPGSSGEANQKRASGAFNSKSWPAARIERRQAPVVLSNTQTVTQASSGDQNPAAEDSEIVARDRIDERLAVIGFWTRFVLVAVLTLSLFWWPYGTPMRLSTRCVSFANVTVIVAGLTLAVQTWRDQWRGRSSSRHCAPPRRGQSLRSTHFRGSDMRQLGETSTAWSCPANP